MCQLMEIEPEKAKENVVYNNGSKLRDTFILNVKRWRRNDILAY